MGNALPISGTAMSPGSTSPSQRSATSSEATGAAANGDYVDMPPIVESDDEDDPRELCGAEMARANGEKSDDEESADVADSVVRDSDIRDSGIRDPLHPYREVTELQSCRVAEKIVCPKHAPQHHVAQSCTTQRPQQMQ